MRSHSKARSFEGVYGSLGLEKNSNESSSIEREDLTVRICGLPDDDRCSIESLQNKNMNFLFIFTLILREEKRKSDISLECL